MPMHDDLNARLSEYLDDELDAAERAAVEAHLQVCEACRTDLRDLAAVVARAGTLPDTSPARNLWPDVERRIAPPRVLRPSFSTRRFAFTMPQLVAAGLALMIASGGLVWLARLGGDRTDFPAIIGQAPPAVRPANFGDAAFDQAVADLQQTLATGRGRLDAQTIRVLESNLESIDRAIMQCREALAADPANGYLNSYLAETRQRKLELLRRATALVDQSM
jgi:anti-sigma factor RsiW